MVRLINLNKVLQGIEGAARAGSAVWTNIIEPVAGTISNVLEMRSSQEATEENEECFGGIPVSELDRMARESFRGDGAEIEDGALIFKSHSRSGKTRGRMHFYLDDEGKLERPTFTYYPGQYCTPAEIFWGKLNDTLTEKE